MYRLEVYNHMVCSVCTILFCSDHILIGGRRRIHIIHKILFHQILNRRRGLCNGLRHVELSPSNINITCRITEYIAEQRCCCCCCPFSTYCVACDVVVDVDVVVVVLVVVVVTRSVWPKKPKRMWKWK